MRNPFQYGSPVEDDHFAGRTQELAALVSRMRNGINVVVVSPRRYGKTSLIRKAERGLGAQRAVVDVNVLRCKDLHALVAQLAQAAFRVHGMRSRRARHALGDFLSRLRVAPTVSFGPDGTPRFSFEPSFRPAVADDVIGDVFGLLSEEAEAGRPAVAVFDEFQAVPDLDPHLPGLLKGLSDQHPHVSVVLAGSKRHLMEELVTEAGAPLYGMAERLALGPIDDDAMAAYLTERAAVGGKPLAAGAARLVLDLAGPVPNDIQRLAYEAFDAAARRRIDAAAVEAGMAQAVSHEAALYAEHLERLPAGQRRVLAVLAQGTDATPASAAFVAAVGLANASSVKKALDALAADETVGRDGARYRISDPFFAAWLRD